MEKRLINSYDHMTMPEDCARRIESRLQAELEAREAGRYTKVVAPHSYRRSGWAIAAACLLLVMVMGGAVFGLGLMAVMVDAPRELAADYSAATDIPAEQVEAFAAEIRQNILEEDWEAFSEKIAYPVTILVRGLGEDTTVRERCIEGAGGMVGLFLRNTVNPSFLEEIRREDCRDLHCSWQGVSLADGRIWINEVDGQLKITSVNGVFADAPEAESFVIKAVPSGYAVVEYAGLQADIEVPEIVTQIGTGEPVIRHGDIVQAVRLPEGIRVVCSNAFADCPELLAVYFQGDAPAEAENVFEGSENAVVYYRQGTKGWGDTWCGRKTVEYGEGYLSLGTATVADRVPGMFEQLLSGEAVPFYGNTGDMTVEECCAALWGDGVKPEAFTLVDMDDDGVCELVFSPLDGEGKRLGYLVLRQDGTKICRYTVSGRDLRKDGTFYSYVLKGDSRIYIQDEASFVSIQSAEFTQQDKPLAAWHTYPCQLPTLVLESYRYASETGFSTYPGEILCAYFGTLLSGDADWNSVQPWLEQQSVYVEEAGTFYAFDPDAPGCLMYGTLIGTGEQRRLTALGYYICSEEAEYRAEAFDLETDKPVYTVDPPPNDRGREVGSAEAMLDHLGIDLYGSETPRDAQGIAELLDRFVNRYAEHDMTGMQEYMAATAGDLSSYPFTGQVSILTFGILPDTAMDIGEKWATTVELLESGTDRANYHLDVILVKEADGWKIQSYSIDKQ